MPKPRSRLRGLAASAFPGWLLRRDTPARQAVAATLAYLVITLAMTWPLARGLGRDVPSELSNPLHAMWALAWDAEQLLAIARGDLPRVASFFAANIFHPAPLPLAYSDHLFAQALQIAPLYAATRNPILCYNLLLLASFVLSGLGGFLFVRAVSGSTRAGFVGGLLFAFALYRWTQLPSLAVLSAQWMPFTLYGVYAYFETRRVRALAGATAALIASNLSSAYHLLYFAPVAGVFALWQIAARGLWRDRRVWLQLGIAAVLTAAATVPFLVPYAQLRATFSPAAEFSDIVRHSADVYSYFTAADSNRAWGGAMRAFPKPEGFLFPGAIPLLLAASAVGCRLVANSASGAAADRLPGWVLGVAAAIAVYVIFALAAIYTRRFEVELGPATIRVTNMTRLLLPPAIALLALSWASRAARSRLAAIARSPEAFLLFITVGAWWLSLGPSPRVLGRPLELWSPYALLRETVPGFDVLRVPARFAMIVALGLSMLGGLAVARLAPRRRMTVMLAVCVAFLVEASTVPLPMNVVAPIRDYAQPEGRIYRPGRAPAVYRLLAETPAHAVVLELPFGQRDYDARSVYYSSVHWRKITNGYAHFYPPHYHRAIAAVAGGPVADDVAWEALRYLGVTHVVVHESAYLDGEGARVNAWLRARGATAVFEDGRDSLFEVHSAGSSR